MSSCSESKHKKLDKNDFYDDKYIADFFSITVSRLRSKLCQMSEPNQLPPRIIIPGTRKRLWPKNEFYDWLNKFRVGSSKEVSNGK